MLLEHITGKSLAQIYSGRIEEKRTEAVNKLMLDANETKQW